MKANLYGLLQKTQGVRILGSNILFFFSFFEEKKLNSNQNLPERQLFVFFVSKTYLGDRILSKKFSPAAG
jgi:hypothetical protein